MLASDFVKQLADAAPSEEDLLRVGLTIAESQAWRESHFFRRREVPLQLAESNELLALMKEWHTGHVQIGMVGLFEEPVTTQRGVQVGEVEVDPLIVLNTTGEVICEDFESDGHLLWQVAQSADGFLDALIVAARFLQSRAVGRTDFNDFTAAETAAEHCASFAGGSHYLAFYWMLLGVQW